VLFVSYLPYETSNLQPFGEVVPDKCSYFLQASTVAGIVLE
jgi:hypothetical protein